MKIVIITGGSRGIGAATALDCARDGMGVILTYNANRQKAEEVVAQIKAEGGSAVALPLDVSVSSTFGTFRQMVTETLASVWSRDSFDALVNNAGYGVFTPLEVVSEEEFDGLFRVHLKGPFFLTQTLLPLMVDGGHIVNLASATSRVATAGVAPYAPFVLVPMIVHAVGIALVFAPGTVTILQDVPQEHAGVASGLLQMDQQIGGALGIAVIAAVYAGGAVPGEFTAGLGAAFALAAAIALLAAAVAATTISSRRRVPSRVCPASP